MSRRGGGRRLHPAISPDDLRLDRQQILESMAAAESSRAIAGAAPGGGRGGRAGDTVGSFPRPAKEVPASVSVADRTLQGGESGTAPSIIPDSASAFDSSVLSGGSGSGPGQMTSGLSALGPMGTARRGGAASFNEEESVVQSSVLTGLGAEESNSQLHEDESQWGMREEEERRMMALALTSRRGDFDGVLIDERVGRNAPSSTSSWHEPSQRQLAFVDDERSGIDTRYSTGRREFPSRERLANPSRDLLSTSLKARMVDLLNEDISLDPSQGQVRRAEHLTSLAGRQSDMVGGPSMPGSNRHQAPSMQEFRHLHQSGLPRSAPLRPPQHVQGPGTIGSHASTFSRRELPRNVKGRLDNRDEEIISLSRLKRRKISLSIWILLNALSCLAFGLIMVSQKRSNYLSVAPETEEMSSGGLSGETKKDDEMRRLFIRNILEPSVYPPGAFDNERSPQSRALRWILDRDPLEVPVPTNAVQSAKIAQRFALAVLYFATRGNSWTLSHNFLTGVDECDWNTIDFRGLFSGAGMCDRKGMVTTLALWQNNLNGMIPSEITLLTALERMSLYRNELRGELPRGFSALPNLRTLYLHDNNLSGSLEFMCPLKIDEFRSDCYDEGGSDTALVGCSCCNVCCSRDRQCFRV